MNKYLEETPLLDFHNKKIEELVQTKKWMELEELDRIKEIYNYIRDSILFGYNVDDKIKASKVLKDGFGQCNTKGILFMALLRCCNIPCRIHGFTIDKKLQEGAMTGFVYKKAPKNILHSWVEVYYDNNWFELEGFILDKPYLTHLQNKFIEVNGPFMGYGVAVKDFKKPVIDFNKNNTYIQSEGINQDFGIYDNPDLLFNSYKQELSRFKRFLFRHYGRHKMNKNVKKVRSH